MEFEQNNLSITANIEDIEKLPEKGWSIDDVLKGAQNYMSCGETDWKTGSESGTVYNGR